MASPDLIEQALRQFLVVAGHVSPARPPELMGASCPYVGFIGTTMIVSGDRWTVSCHQ
ncbi:MAG TPA: hypothetical protein VGH27_28060 [Streptosporangiaceae bacterium]|jgi:hypothetical protein